MPNISLIKKDGQRKYLLPSERDKFIYIAKNEMPRTKTFCLMLTNTGCLMAEVLNIQNQNINLQQKTIIIHTLRKRSEEAKGVPRIVPLSDVFINELASVHNLTRLATISPTNKLWNWSRSTAFNKVKQVMKKAGINGLHASAFGIRHAFGLRCTRKGVPIILIKKWMGHSSLDITEAYLLKLDQDERLEASKMW